MTVYELKGRRIQVVSISAEHFRAGKHPLLADADYRKKKRVRWILGAVFDERGVIALEFGRGYDARGRYIGERVLKSSQIALGTLAQIKKTLRSAAAQPRRPARAAAKEGRRRRRERARARAQARRHRERALDSAPDA